MSFLRTAATSSLIGSLAAGVFLVATYPATGSVDPSRTGDRPVDEGLATEWDDGLDRYFVTVDSVALDESAARDDEALALDLADVETGERLTVGDLQELDPDLAAALIRRGMVVGVPEIELEALLVAHLESLPGVEQAVALSPTTAEIATGLSAAEVADLAGVTDSVESLPLIAFDWEPTDDWFGAGWQLKSSGQTFDGRTYDRDTDVDAPEAWDTARGGGVVIAVVDGGFTADPVELAPNLWTNDGEVCGNGADDDLNGFVDDCHGWDFYNRVPLRSYDGSSSHLAFGRHGVAVASAAAAPAGNNGVVGVAPEAQIMMLGAGNGQQLSSGAVAAAVDYAIANGADVINFSFGSVLQPYNVSAYRNYYRPMLDAVEAADIVLVAAAGNSGQSVGSTPSSPAYFVAERANGLAVAATDPGDELASYSQWGDWVSLAAPGSDIALASPDGPIRYMSGTSFASPVTAGAAAVLRSAHPSASAADVVGALEEGSDRLPRLARRVPYGRRVNVDRALDVLEGEVLLDISFTNLVDMGPTARVAASAETGDAVTFTLAVMVDERVRAVPGQVITWNGTTATTDAVGRAAFTADLHGGVDGAFHVAGLPAGAYGLIAQASNAGVPFDEPVLTVFTVGLGSTPVTTTIAPIPSTTRPGTPTATTTTTPNGTGGPVSQTTVPSGGQGGSGGSSGAGGSGGSSAHTTTTTTSPSFGVPGSRSGGDPGGGGGITTTTAYRGGRVAPAPTTSTTTSVSSPPSTEPGVATPKPRSESQVSASGIRISSVSPTSIPTDGGVVVVYGSKLPPYPVVTVGGAPARLIARFGDQTMIVEVGRGPVGWADVSVSPIADPGDVATLTNALQYVAPPGSGSSGSGGVGSTGGSGSTGGGSGGWPSPTTRPNGTVTTTTMRSASGPSPTTSTTAPGSVSPTPDPSTPTTSPDTPSTTRVPYDTAQPMGWNVPPDVDVAPIGVEGAGITLDDWNDAYRPSGTHTGVRLGGR